MTSFAQIHELTNRAVPEMMRIYKMAIQLHKLYNSNDHSLEWVSLNENQILTSRQAKFYILKSNKYKVGLNSVTNRLSCLNGLAKWQYQSIQSKM